MIKIILEKKKFVHLENKNKFWFCRNISIIIMYFILVLEINNVTNYNENLKLNNKYKFMKLKKYTSTNIII